MPLAPLGWEHIVLTGEYRWDLGQVTTLENLRLLRLRALASGPQGLSGRNPQFYERSGSSLAGCFTPDDTVIPITRVASLILGATALAGSDHS